MGLYATTTSLETMMIGTSLSNLTATALKVVARAESRVNATLSRRYNLSSSYFQTTTSIPPMVREWSEMLAEGHFRKALSRGGAGKEMMELGKGLIKEVMDDLERLEKYKINLCDTAGSLIPDMSDTSYQVLCNTTNYTPTFDEGDELAWVPDPDKIEDISDAKD